MINKLIIFTAEAYITGAVNDSRCYQREALLGILTNIKGYRAFHRFDKDQHKKIVELGKSETAEAIKSVEVDFSVYALELLNVWVDEIPKSNRPRFNLSDKRINATRAKLVKDMLQLKHRDAAEYEEVKKIVDQSRMTAKRFFHHFHNELETA